LPRSDIGRVAPRAKNYYTYYSYPYIILYAIISTSLLKFLQCTAVSYSVPLKVCRQVIINQRGFSYHRGPPGYGALQSLAVNTGCWLPSSINPLPLSVKLITFRSHLKTTHNHKLHREIFSKVRAVQYRSGLFMWYVGRGVGGGGGSAE